MRKFAVCTFACLAATLTYDISPGCTLPEDIVPVPSDFGTLGGTYFVDNPTINASGTGQVLNVTSGGVVTTFASFPSPQTLQPLGGAFLPSNYGAAAGQFLAAGENSSNRSLKPGRPDQLSWHRHQSA